MLLIPKVIYFEKLKKNKLISSHHSNIILLILNLITLLHFYTYKDNTYLSYSFQENLFFYMYEYQFKQHCIFQKSVYRQICTKRNILKALFNVFLVQHQHQTAQRQGKTRLFHLCHGVIQSVTSTSSSSLNPIFTEKRNYYLTVSYHTDTHL